MIIETRLVLKAFEKRRIADADLSKDLQAEIVPSPNPVAIMQIGMARVSIADESLVVAPAGAQRTGPAGVAIVLTIDMAAVEKVRLLFAVYSGRDIAQRVRIGIHKAVAGRNVS